MKAHKLAIRRAMLGLLAAEGFTDPNRTFLLYDEVRSFAIHGEEAPEVGDDIVRRFAEDVRRALNEILVYTEAEGIARRKALREALDNHPRRENVKAGLRKRSPKLWEEYFAKEEPDDA